jgi:autotransporter family porin
MKKIAGLLLSMILILNLSAQEIIYVNKNANGKNKGKSWSDAFNDLQSALEQVKTGGEIWVAQGIYLPTTDNNREATFQLKENVTLYGGFNGDEKNHSERDWENNKTILSGNIGDINSKKDNSIHVVTTANNAVLDGFIVEDGYALSNRERKTSPGKQKNERTNGGDQRREASGPPQTHTTPQNIMMAANSAGAGILNFKTAAIIRNTIVRNCSAGKGGGVYNMTNTTGHPANKGATPVFINVKIQGNYAFGRGGGMQNDLGTSPVLINCEFTENFCDAKGGGLYNDFNCSPIIINSSFTKNYAYDAAAIGNDGSSCPVIIGTEIENNTVKGQGAGLYQGSYNANLSGQGNSPVVINSVIKNNNSETNGQHNIVNWGEDWVFAYNSEIEGFNYSKKEIDKKYSAMTEISKAVKNLSASDIHNNYLNEIIKNLPKKELGKRGGKRGFGTDNVLSKTVDIPRNIVFVNASAKIKNADGKTWNTAFGNLQKAIDAAFITGGGELWVAKGVYKPTVNNNRNISFEMKENVAVFGGFSGNEKDKSSRNISANKTILSGNIGDEKAKTDNSYHVIKGSVNSVIDGVTICDGYANGEITNRYGGGMFNWGYESSTLVKNCVFADNYAEDGGAVFCFKDVLSYFENVRFENNKAINGGAASFRFGASCELNNCTFTNNVAVSRGGGVVINYGSNVIVSNSGFKNNTSKGNGGAIWVNDQASQYGGTQPQIIHCSFSNNSAKYYGGAIHNYNVSTTIINNSEFNKNSAGFGNDVANTLRCQVKMDNNKLNENEIYTDESSLVFTANTNSVTSNKVTSEKTLDDVDFSVTIIGSGSPQYDLNRSDPSALVQYKGVKFLVDMGNGTKNQLAKIGLSGRNGPDALLITHHHLDHNEEFFPMVHQKIMSPGKFLIAGPKPIQEMTDYVVKFYNEDLDYRKSGAGKTFDENNINATVKELQGKSNFEYKGVKVSTTEVLHTIYTLAYRFDVGGKSIVISGDLTYSPNLPILAKNADVLVIDGQIIRKNANRNASSTGTNKQRKTGNKAHSSIEETARMAAESNVKTLIITHLGAEPIDVEATKEKIGEQFKGEVIIAEDFLTVSTEGDVFILSEVENISNGNKNRNKGTNTSNNGNSSGNRSENRMQQSITGGNPIQRFDTNNDNKLSKSESSGMIKDNFDRIDTNGDGFIDNEEIKNRRSKK